MAPRRVIVYPLHEYEIERVAGVITDTAEPTPGYRVGIMDEADVEQLRAENIIVQYLGGDDAGDAQATSPSPAAARMSLGFEADVSFGLALGAPDPDEFANWRVELSGPLTEDVSDVIDATGGELAEAMSRFHYLVVGTTAMVDELVALPAVVDVRRHTGPEAGAVPLSATPPVSFDLGAEVAQRTWDVIASSGKWLAQAQQWLDDRGVEAEQISARALLVLDDPDSDVIGALANLPGVISVVEHIEPELQLDHLRAIVGVAAAPLPANGPPFDGSGQIVGVADTGVDDSHPDLVSQLAGTEALGRPGDSSDPDGHGTHVAAIIAGTGAASGGVYAGIAPGAQLWFQSLYRSAGARLAGLPSDVGQLLDSAYANGARIHNDSWGTEVNGAYDGRAVQIDEWVRAHPDMVVVIAAGNSGDASAPHISPLGYTDEYSVTSPATAKNAITVGASRSDRPGSPTHLEFDRLKFPDPPTSDALLSGDPQSLAGFSSRGPCDDERVKPDVVAPGTCVISARSARADDSQFESVEAGGHYAQMSGTSMAAPVVAGLAAIVREFLVRDRGINPSAALVKAMLVNGTRPLGGADAVLGGADLPNAHQGFGLVDLASTLPTASTQMAFIDSWSADPGPALGRRGDRRRYQIDVVRPGMPLRATLVWTDLAARSVQQILRLFGELPNNEKIIGNQSRAHRAFRYDATNTVETLRLDAAPVGSYLFNVVAERLVSTAEPQHWALVVTGGFDGELTLRGNY